LRQEVEGLEILVGVEHVHARRVPAARAFWARRAISSSTFLPTVIILSAELVHDDHDVGAQQGDLASPAQPVSATGPGLPKGSRRGLPVVSASLILRL
jgi:hypothetical protein